MKKIFVPLMLFFALLVSGCSGNSEEKGSSDKTEKAEEKTTVTYESETGPIEVPADPQRVILLSGFVGNALELGVNVVGVDAWAKANPTYADQLKDIEEVSEENLEKIIELEPDLIIALSTVKNLDKISDIAPTVTYTWGKLNYLDQHVELGKLLNKEEKAKTWAEDFKVRAEEAGKKVKEKLGEDVTVSVVEAFDKQLYVFGNNWARGTEILYQAMDLKMPEKVTADALEPGYFEISAEVLGDYVGDYLFISKYAGADVSFQETETYKNFPAVKNNRVFEMDGNTASFTDPITLDQQLKFFEESFLNGN